MARHFKAPIFTIQRTNLQQLIVLIDLVLDIEPALTDDFIISLEDVDDGLMTASKKSTSSTASVVRSTIREWRSVVHPTWLSAV